MIIKAIKKLLEFFVNLTSQKTAEIPKAKTPKKSSSDAPIKQTVQIPENEIPLSTDDNGIILVSEESIPKLEPGFSLDTCTLKNCEDFSTIGHVLNSLPNKPIYVPSLVRDEFHDKECTKSGRLRNFDEALAGLAKSLHRKIYYVEIGTQTKITSWHIRNLSKYLLAKWKRFGLHHPDNIHIAFAKFTRSTIITSDKIMIRCLKQEQMEYIEFQELTEKIMQPSPITIYHRERRNYLKNKKYRGRKG